MSRVSYPSKAAMWADFHEANVDVIDNVGLGYDLPRIPEGWAVFDPLDRLIEKRWKRVTSMREAFYAAVRGRPRWENLQLDVLQEIVDQAGSGKPGIESTQLRIPYDPTAPRRRGRGHEKVSAADRAAAAAALARLGLTFDAALGELLEERASGAHPFVSKNMVYDRLWRNIRQHIDFMDEGDRRAFLASLDARDLTSPPRSKSRAAKMLIKRVVELNPRSGDFIFDEEPAGEIPF